MEISLTVYKTLTPITVVWGGKVMHLVRLGDGWVHCFVNPVSVVVNERSGVIRKLIREIIHLFLAGVVMVIVLIVALVYEEKRVRPLFHVRTISELRERFPHEIQREASYLTRGSQVTCVYLRLTTNPLIWPSGPPAIIFDKSGLLIDYCYDVGDSPSFVEKWELQKSWAPQMTEGPEH